MCGGAIPNGGLRIDVGSEPGGGVGIEGTIQRWKSSIQWPALNADALEVILAGGRPRLRGRVLVVDDEDVEAVGASGLGIELGGKIVLVIQEIGGDDIC